MRNKLSVVILCALLIGAFSVSLYGASKEVTQRTWFKLDRAPKYMIPYEKEVGQIPWRDESQIPLGMIKSSAAGTVAGYTTYDYQHNGTMTRQLTTDNTYGVIQFCWMAQNNKIIPGDRGIKWNALMGGVYSAPTGGKYITTEYSGYCSIATWDYGLGAMACHTKPVEDYFSTTYVDYLPGNGIFSDRFIATPDEEADWYIDDMETIWPVIDVHHGGNTGVTETVVYMLAHGYEGTEDMILYRSVGDSMVIFLDDTTYIPYQFDHGTYIETVTDLAYMVVADPNSDRVAVVYTDDRRGEDEGSGTQNDLDVWYMLSTNQGATWDRTDRTGEGVLISQAGRYCVSQYDEEDSLWRAYSDLNAVWTPDGNLHIVWAARELLDANTYEQYKSRLIHWSTDISKARIVAEARHTMKNAAGLVCDAGAWNMYIAKPSVSWCDGKVYALWTQFGMRGYLNDCSALGFANGELLLCVSNDNGLTWDNATNLTNSHTPNATDSTCQSDHWSSMAAYGMIYSGMDTLDIMYINDKSAGGIPQGEGIWCTNPVMHLRTSCRAINNAPKIAFGVNSYLDPLHTLPGTPLATTMTVFNIGNAPMTGSLVISYVNGAANTWITLEGAQTTGLSIAAGDNNTQEVDVVFNRAGVLTTNPSGWDAYIIALTDAATSPDTIPVHLTVATDFDMPASAIVATTNKQLKIWNTGRVGDNEPGATLGFPRGAYPTGDCDSLTDNPDIDIWLYDGSPALSWKDGTVKKQYAAVWSQIFTDDGTWRPQTSLTVETANPTYNLARYTICTADSIFGCDVRLFFPKDGNDFVIGKLNFYLWKDCPVNSIDDVNVGYFVDWDLPADSSVDNGSGYELIAVGDDTISTVYQYGAEYHLEDNGDCNIDEGDRFGGIVYINGQFKNGWTTQNRAVQQGSFVLPGWLYDQMVKTVYTLHTAEDRDSLIDLHTGVTFETIDMVKGDHYDYVFALITSIASGKGTDTYLAQVSAAFDWAETLKLFCCEKAGDANNDGSVNVGDQVYVNNYVFKPTSCATNPPVGCPPSCTAEGDANSDASINVGDAVYLGNYVFKASMCATNPPIGCPPKCGPTK